MMSHHVNDSCFARLGFEVLLEIVDGMMPPCQTARYPVLGAGMGLPEGVTGEAAG